VSAVAHTSGRLILIRHGQTADNGQRYCGWEDTPLNSTGLEQADRLAAQLRDMPLTLLVSSPLRRAIATAAPLAAQHQLPICECPDLREIHYGALQGRAKDALSLRLRRDYRTTRLPGGESLEDLYQRTQRAAEWLQRQRPAHAAIGVVGHYWSLRTLAAALLGIQFNDMFEQLRYKPGNGSAVELPTQAPDHQDHVVFADLTISASHQEAVEC
jgi:broad specificity phosphatase PhoE